MEYRDSDASVWLPGEILKIPIDREENVRETIRLGSCIPPVETRIANYYVSLRIRKEERQTSFLGARVFKDGNKIYRSFIVTIDHMATARNASRFSFIHPTGRRSR